MLTAPAYVASGIPLEGLLLFNAVEAVIDLPKTLLNVTGTMTAATIVSRVVTGERSTAITQEPS